MEIGSALSYEHYKLQFLFTFSGFGGRDERRFLVLLFLEKKSKNVNEISPWILSLTVAKSRHIGKHMGTRLSCSSTSLWYFLSLQKLVFNNILSQHCCLCIKWSSMDFCSLSFSGQILNLS